MFSLPMSVSIIINVEIIDYHQFPDFKEFLALVNFTSCVIYKKGTACTKKTSNAQNPLLSHRLTWPRVYKLFVKVSTAYEIENAEK